MGQVQSVTSHILESGLRHDVILQRSSSAPQKADRNRIYVPCAIDDAAADRCTSR